MKRFKTLTIGATLAVLCSSISVFAAPKMKDRLKDPILHTTVIHTEDTIPSVSVYVQVGEGDKNNCHPQEEVGWFGLEEVKNEDTFQLVWTDIPNCDGLYSCVIETYHIGSDEKSPSSSDKQVVYELKNSDVQAYVDTDPNKQAIDLG